MMEGRSGVRRSRRLVELVTAVYESGDRGATRTELARAVDMTRSPHLYGLLDELVNSGRVVVQLDRDLYPPAFKYYAPGREPAIPVEEGAELRQWLSEVGQLGPGGNASKPAGRVAPGHRGRSDMWVIGLEDDEG